MSKHSFSTSIVPLSHPSRVHTTSNNFIPLTPSHSSFQNLGVPISNIYTNTPMQSLHVPTNLLHNNLSNQPTSSTSPTYDYNFYAPPHQDTDSNITVPLVYPIFGISNCSISCLIILLFILFAYHISNSNK